MLAAPGVSCVCSDVPRSKSDRVGVENALCRSIRVTASGADDARTVFWRTTGQVSLQFHPCPSTKTRRFLVRSRRPAMAPSLRFRNSVAFTIDTNVARPERSYCLRQHANRPTTVPVRPSQHLQARRILSSRASDDVRDDIGVLYPAQQIDGAGGLHVSRRNALIGDQIDFVVGTSSCQSPRLT
jgi:hypothetical protein